VRLCLKFSHNMNANCMQGHNTEMPLEWPKPTQLSEKWRYVTIRACLESIGQPNSQSTPKQQQKADYESTVNSATDDILTVVKDVSFSDENSKTVKEIRDIVRLAADFWLKMGSQRCRIIVMLPNLGDDMVDGKRREHLPKQLVVQPELRRIGNFLGQQLDNINDVVGECHSDIHDLSW